MEEDAAQEPEPAHASSPAAGVEPAELAASSEPQAADGEGPSEPEQDTDEDDWDEDEDEDDDALPSFEFRVETAKLLIELDEDNYAATQVPSGPAHCCCISLS